MTRFLLIGSTIGLTLISSVALAGGGVRDHRSSTVRDHRSPHPHYGGYGDGPTVRDHRTPYGGATVRDHRGLSSPLVRGPF